MQKPLRVSIIITTYNRPDALVQVLKALNHQEGAIEVLIADDGSTAETAAMLEMLTPSLSYPCHHVWQEDCGFRAARARNIAVVQASGDYLIFLDGDCIPVRHFVQRHLRLAEPGYWVTGNRILLNAMYTQQVLDQGIDVSKRSLFFWLQRRFSKACNRLLPLLPLPLGVIRKWRPRQWRGAKTCNLAVWKSDFDSVKGFNESYEGWGYEDSDFVIRLIQQGVYRKSGRYAVPVLHLWHPENDRSTERENFARLQHAIAGTRGEEEKGMQGQETAAKPSSEDAMAQREAHRISAYIIAYNEKEKIEAAINSVLWADEILVIDSHSTDGTAELAEAMGARVVQVPFKGFGDLRNQALNACQYPWIFSLDADERCTPEVRDNILSIVREKASLDVYYVPRKNFFMGRWIKYSGWYPNYRQPQLFKKNALSYLPDPVHERFEIHSTQPIGYLTSAIWQTPFKDLSEVMSKANRYSSLGVKKLQEKNKKISMGSALGRGVWAFIKHYVFKKGFLDGWAGFMIAVGNFYGTYFRYAKYYEAVQQWKLPEAPPLKREIS